MENKYQWKQLLAGLFFILCIAVVVFAIFIIGVQKGFTEPKLEMTALFGQVGGLGVGAPVRLSGVTVGTVADIYFLDEEVNGRGIGVKLSIFSKYEKQVYKTSRVAIITEGVLGDKMIEISTDDPRSGIEDLSAPIIGEDPLDVQNLAQTFGDAAASLLETSKMINNMTQDLDIMAETTKRLLNRIEQRIIEGTLFKVF